MAVKAPLGAVEFVKGVEAGNISALEHAHKICEEIEAKNKKFWHFNFFDKKAVLEQAEALERKSKKAGRENCLGFL